MSLSVINLELFLAQKRQVNVSYDGDEADGDDDVDFKFS